MDSLGVRDGDDDITDDEYESDVDEEDVDSDDTDDEELIVEGEDELLDLLEDSRIDRTLEAYVEDGANLFSVSKLEDLEKGEDVKRTKP